MNSVLKLISVIGLALTIIPSVLVFQGSLELASSKTLMLIGTVCWFLSTPFWLGKKPLKKNAT